MPTTISGSSGVTFPDATTQTTAATASVPAGAITNFVNASAPTGWTQVTTYNNYAMRVVSGTGAGTGGSVDFTTAFANGTVGATTLSLSQIPSHTHQGSPTVTQYLSGNVTVSANVFQVTNNSDAGFTTRTQYTYGSSYFAVASNGSGGSHDHSLSLAVRYVDNILCQKS